MLEVHDVVTGYGRVSVLKRISLAVGPGEVLAVVGTNGAGKTTLVSAVAGARPLWEGRVVVDGDDVTALGPEGRTRLGIVLCPEGRRIFSTLTVEENLVAGATCLRRSLGRSAARLAIRDELERAYELFPILRERRTSSGGTLSGGQQQMLAIARALMARPRFLLLDEPSLGLAPRIIHELYLLYASLRDGGLGIVLVEESPARALAFADRALVLRRGASVMAGTAREVAEHAELAGAYLGSAPQ
jgi:branched-chain amino acid transport system ATP-binding protein